MIHWVQVDSNMLTAIGHDGKKLYVRFKKGTEYVYENVPVETINAFLSSPSKGGFFLREIKDSFTAKKLDS